MYEIYQKLLDEKGIKNADVSRATGISNMTLSDWKNGKSTPKQDKLMKIADYFGVSLDYLMTGKEPNVGSLYSDENADLLIYISKNQEILLQMKKYITLDKDKRKSVDDMIDFLSSKKQQGED